MRDGEFPHCGVQCSPDNHIQDIRLENNGLSGPLPASVSAMTGLKTLDLTYNALSGALPQGLAGMSGKFTSNLQLLVIYGTLLRAGL